MKNQPNRDYDSNDVVMTPPKLAERIVSHFNPTGKLCDPCYGAKAFSSLLEQRGKTWICDIADGPDHDFLNILTPHHFDWIITNPPWSKIRAFLQRSMEVADNIVFLMTVNHVWTKARIRDIKKAGFGIKEICLVEMPKEFPQSGFQLGAIHLEKGWDGGIKMNDISV